MTRTTFESTIEVEEESAVIPDVLTKEDEAVTVLMNPNGIVQKVSDSVKKVLGYDPERLSGSLFFRYIYHRDLLEIFSGIAELITGYEREKTMDLHVKTASGTWLACRAGARIQVNGHKIAGILLTLYPVAQTFGA